MILRILACLAVAGAMLAATLPPPAPSHARFYVSWKFQDTASTLCPFRRTARNGSMVEGLCVRTSTEGLVQVVLPGWESAWLPPDQIDQGLVDEFQRWWDRAQLLVKSCQPEHVSWMALRERHGVCALSL